MILMTYLKKQKTKTTTTTTKEYFTIHNELNKSMMKLISYGGKRQKKIN